MVPTVTEDPFSPLSVAGTFAYAQATILASSRYNVHRLQAQGVMFQMQVSVHQASGVDIIFIHSAGEILDQRGGS